MRRRDFCKSIAFTAAASAIPLFGQSEQDAPPDVPAGFNHYSQSYAEFCDLPPEKRVFYKVSGNRIVETKLDEANWQQSPWNYAQLQKRSRAGFGTTFPWLHPSPISPELARTSQPGTRCRSTRRLSGTGTRSSESGRTGVLSVWRKTAIGTLAMFM